MQDKLDLYFDFASPYAYFAFGRLCRLADRHRLTLCLHPIMLWATLRALGLPAAMEHPARREYMLHDMQRSARHYGLPFELPPAFPFSSHAAARAWHAVHAHAPQLSTLYAARLLEAGFVQHRDIRNKPELVEITAELGLGESWARPAMDSDSARAALERTIAEAAQRGVSGSPYWFWRGEAWFGADRLPQFEQALLES